MSLESIPTLDDLTRDPMTATSLPAPIVEALLAKSAVVQSILISRLLALRAQPQNGSALGSDGGDRLLRVNEAARKLGISTDHLYRHAEKYPFTVRDGRSLRFSEAGIEKYIRQRMGK